MDDAVDLGAHAQLLQVDPRLDGKAGALCQDALIGELHGVQVHPVAVHACADGVPGAVPDAVREPPLR